MSKSTTANVQSNDLQPVHSRYDASPLQVAVRCEYVTCSLCEWCMQENGFSRKQTHSLYESRHCINMSAQTGAAHSTVQQDHEDIVILLHLTRKLC